MLCEPDNDPLNHPAVAPHVQQELKAFSMRDWVSAGWAYTDLYWPFGHGRQRNEGATYVLGPGRKALGQIMHFAAEFAMTKGRSSSKRFMDASSNYSTHSKWINGMASAKHPLSCVLKISTEARPGHMSSGNLFVNLVGYGRKLGADLQVLSSFRLRAVGPGIPGSRDLSPSPQLDSTGKFSYGNLLNENWIDPEMGRLWLGACEIGHGPECGQHGWDLAMQKPKFLRVIDVNELCVKVAPNPAQCRFVALSYVWGGAGMMRFQLSNMDELMKPGSLLVYLKDLPKTIVDAIEMVRGMGEKFLWVDALCILQGDAVETTEAFGSMDTVYGNAIATIVAAQGDSANAGLAGVKSKYLPEIPESPAHQRHLHQRSAVVKDSMSLVAPLTTQDHDLENSAWNTRAWTFQERLLSRRLIVFTHGQMIWHCRKTICREDMSVEDSGIPYKPLSWLSLRPRYLGVDTGTTWIDGSTETTRHGSTRLVRSATFGEYAKMIEQYTHRHMSYQSDVLNAAAGLLHIFSLCFKCGNLYGLPETHLDIALLWRPTQPLQRRQGFPSWSWAGWKGRVAYDEPFKIDRTNDGRFVAFTRDSSGEEGLRPILRWHIARAGKPVPLNGNGLGIPFDGAVLPREWENGPYCMDSSGHGGIVQQPPDVRLLPRGIDPSQCLIFWTGAAASAKIRLGQAIVQESDRRWNPNRSPKRFRLVDEDRYVIGNVLLDTGDEKWMDAGRYEFIQLAEAVYAGADDEERDVEDCPYYVVMLVEWDARGQVAERRGLGRVHKAAWMLVGPKLKMICLA